MGKKFKKFKGILKTIKIETVNAGKGTKKAFRDINKIKRTTPFQALLKLNGKRRTKKTSRRS